MCLRQRAVLSVAQLHAGALLALATRPGGLCATGSADGVLRLWGGGDLRAGAAVRGDGGRDRMRQSQNRQTPSASNLSVTSLFFATPTPCLAGIGLSPDGLQVAVGTEGGALCLLHLPSQAYSTLLRAHTAPVHAVAVMGEQQHAAAAGQRRRRYCTAGADGTVRVWEGGSHQQELELSIPGETVLRRVALQPLCCADDWGTHAHALTSRAPPPPRCPAAAWPAIPAGRRSPVDL